MDLRDTNFFLKINKKKKITELKRYRVDPNLQHYCHAFILNNKILYYKTTFIKLQLTYSRCCQSAEHHSDDEDKQCYHYGNHTANVVFCHCG